jgi:radical SAM superfamily enzyme YgiQ (UPF0313 family)
MDILLTHGYFLPEDSIEQRVMKPYPPLGILYLSAYLKMKGFNVGVFDTTFRRKSEFYDYVNNVRPPVVGIYSNLMTKLAVLELIAHCKSIGCKIVVGGPDVPEYAESYLTFGADVAVLGEGEETLVELLPAFIGNRALDTVTGIAFKKDNHTIQQNQSRQLIQNLDMLPLPDRDAIDIPEYLRTWKTHHGMSSVSLICARGCPFTCTWCSRSVYGETHRRRSVKNVVDEIELLISNYHPDMLWFADDVFTINHQWFHDFYDEMLRRKIRIPFECISRADRLNEEILRKMSELGAFRIWYGSESGSQRILDAMQRKVSTEQIRSVTRVAQRYGIQAGLFVMVGYPGEELSDIDATAEHLKKTNADTFLTTVAYPIKGTEFYHSVQHSLAPTANWSQTTDRALQFSGRYSDTFYRMANRYIVNEVLYHKYQMNDTKNYGKRFIAYSKAKLARIGMELLQQKV